MLISKKKLEALLQAAREEEASKYMDKENFTRKYQSLKDVYKMKTDRMYKTTRATIEREADRRIERNSIDAHELYEKLHKHCIIQRIEINRLLGVEHKEDIC